MSSTLYTETSGHGPDLFLVHGWALHSGVWDGLAPELTRAWRVTRVDLPGHGRSREQPMPQNLIGLAQIVLRVAPQNAVWLGWSLGGLAALRAALDAPARVRALVLANSTPKFTAAPGWDCAMPASLLAKFADELQRDYRATVQRFLGLQVRGDEYARDTLRQLRAALLGHGEPQVASLAAGLEILRASDVRPELSRLALPTLVMTGDYDRLTPPEAGVWLADAIRGARRVCIPRAAHAPFLSHAREFLTALRDFLGRLRDDPKAARASGGALGHG